jgi:hypothetical protein
LKSETLRGLVEAGKIFVGIEKLDAVRSSVMNPDEAAASVQLLDGVALLKVMDRR